MEIRIGPIITSGNTMESDEEIKALLPSLKINQTPNARKLSRELLLANENPLRSLSLEYTATSEGAVDVEVVVKERNPLQFGLVLENTGTRDSGRWLGSLFAFHGNVFNLKHQSVVSISTSDKPGRVRVYGAYYRIPISYLDSELTFTASKADIDSGRVANLIDINGSGFTTGVHHRQMIWNSEDWQHFASASLDVRRYNDVFTTAAVQVNTYITSRILGFGYGFQGRTNHGNLAAGISHFQNLPGGVHNNNIVYTQIHPSASPRFEYQRYYASYEYSWDSGWTFSTAVQGQITKDSLISGEKFYMTGLRYIRGLPERDASGDKGYITNTEVLTPGIGDGHRFAAFIDHGRYWHNNPIAPEVGADGILTAGLGWRWQSRHRIKLRLDGARVINGTPGTPKRSIYLHAGVIYWF
jgi:hemolysin activation/secretion protein